ncbi:hypothetical protein RRG08_055379 [Elysia crispata]|uniref:Uncharacterized protein n=1 Tax=Elysia crispata TaxID=231223 RepID=A0AAE1AQZ2_9GAST|nr:hypothetical protein RRG08_055379 [Elysia crispata]
MRHKSRDVRRLLSPCYNGQSRPVATPPGANRATVKEIVRGEVLSLQAGWTELTPLYTHTSPGRGTDGNAVCNII